MLIHKHIEKRIIVIKKLRITPWQEKNTDLKQ